MAKSAAKAGVVNALDYLADPEKHPVVGVCAVYGDDAFLKSEVLVALRRQVLGGDEGEFGLTTFSGREVQLRDVRDVLGTMSLFGDGKRLVIIDEADPFVSEYRGELEDFVAQPSRGVLVLDVKTWPSNTRLARALAGPSPNPSPARGGVRGGAGLAIQCDSPNERQIKTWLTQRAKASHQVRLEAAAAADALLELVPPELGILVQEVAKLALLVGEDRVIGVKLVRDSVGGWRTRATWDLIDAAADGRTAEALAQLDRLMASGEKPHGLLPQIASSLRRFATAMALIESADADRRKMPLREALVQAGVLPFKLNDAERQLRQIGRKRARQLTEWLLAADLAIKSHNSSDDRARMEIERLLVRLGAGSGEHGAGSKATARA